MAIEYKGQKVYTVVDVDQMVKNKNYTTRWVSKRKNTLIEGVDYFQLSAEEYRELTGMFTVRPTKLLTQVCVDKIVEMASKTMKDKKPEDKKPEEKIADKKEKTKVSPIVKPLTNEEIKESKIEVKEVKSEPKPEPIAEPTPEPKPEQKVEVKQEAQIIVDLNKVFQQFVLLQTKQTEILQQQSNIMQNQIIDLHSMLRELMLYNMEHPTIAPNGNDFPDFGTYLKEVNKAIKKITSLQDSKFHSRNEVLKEAYGLLTKEYGIVWEQLKKDFFKIYNRYPVSTIESCWYVEQNPVMRNILLAKLNTIYEQEKAR